MKHNELAHSGKRAFEQKTENLQPGTDGSGLGDAPLSENSHEAFDRAIRQKLSAEAPYSQGNWNRMSARLDLIEERTRFVYRHKLLETSIFLLLFFSARNLFDYSGLHNNIAKNSTILPFQQQEIKGYSAKKFNYGKPADTFKAVSLQHIQKEKNDLYVSAAQEELQQSSTRGEFDDEPIQDTENKENLLPSTAREEVSQLPLPELQNVVHLGSPAFTILKSPSIAERKNHYALSLVSVGSVNQIHTPSEVFLGRNIDAYNKFTIGGGGGFLISRENGKMAIETGLVYLSKQYQPEHISISGTINNGILFRETLNRVQVNMLELPLNVRFCRNTGNDKLSVYAGLGSTLNLISRVNYDFERQYLVSVSALSGLGNSQTASELEKVRNFSPGLFDGGRLRDNAYLSAQVLLGFEYKISPKYSFFNQLGIQRQLSQNGVGANGNHFHAYSILVGLKTQLK